MSQGVRTGPPVLVCHYLFCGSLVKAHTKHRDLTGWMDGCCPTATAHPGFWGAALLQRAPEY